MSKKRENHITAVLHPAVMTKLDQRSARNRSEEISKSLDRYYAMIERSRLALSEVFTDQECGYILDVTNGTLFEAWSIPYIVNELIDAWQDGYGEKWEIEGKESFFSRLVNTTLDQRWAMVDSVEQWWGDTLHNTKEYGVLFKVDSNKN